ncbi:8823_t:CDS:2, partial [Acaulospora morrowiae]
EVDLSAEAFLLNGSTREEIWHAAIVDALGEKSDNYLKLVSKQLVGILLMIFVKKAHMPYIKEVRNDCVGVGLMGMMGNKGGTAIRFQFYDSFLCFVNCHLAADPNGLERRNQDYMEICRRMTFPLNTNEGYSSLYGWVGDYISPPAKYAAAAVVGMGGMVGIPGIASLVDTSPSPVGAGNVLSIFDNDHLIWLGDLNYRIDALPEYKVKEMVDNNELEDLLHFDQLNIQRMKQQAFSEFEEGKITFKPTYKYDVASRDFDKSDKRRIPSWTDRILWRSIKSEWCKQLIYRSHMDIGISDHKPVSAVFELKLRICPPEKEDDDMIMHDNVIILKDNGLHLEIIPDPVGQ